MATGKINVQTENIFPIIKKFLYSDTEIFLRELVSNAVDASQKLKTLSSLGEFKGEDLLLVITQKGIARTFQNIRLFKDLTVLDNIRLAGHFRVKYGLLSSIFRTPKYHSEEERLKNEAMELLKIFGLEEKANHLAKNLPNPSVATRATRS